MSTNVSHGQCLAKISFGEPTTHRKHTFGKKRIPLRRRVVLPHVLRVQSQAGFGRGTVKIKEEEEIDVEAEPEPEPEPPSGTKKFMKLPGTIKLPGPAKSQAKGQSQAKSNKLVFVAGATGKVGSRTVRELLKLGFQVRAGTRNTEKAQALFEDVKQSGPPARGSDDAAPFGFFSPAKLFGFLKPKSSKVLEIVECDLEDVESIESALGNAGVVVCCIGASEKEVLDVSGPYRIDYKATANLIEAASSAQVNHFVLLTSLGTQKFGFPAAVLNLFWGVLVWKAKAEKALFQSGLPYTIVRPGGMERPTDAYKETHNLLLGEADKLFGGQVSNLQVAELIASIVENPEVSVNKIVEAIAETSAPLRPIRELLEEIPAKDDTTPSMKPQSIGKIKPAKADAAAPQKVSKRQEEEKLIEEKRTLALKEKEEQRIQAEKLAKEKLARAQKEKEEKRIRENDEKEKLRLQALRKKYEEEIEAAREKEEAANSAAAAALAEKAELEKRAAEVRAKAEAAALAASQAKAVEAAVLAAARKGNVLSDAEKDKIAESVKPARLGKEDSSKVSKPSLKKKPAFSFFGKAAPTAETDTDLEPESKEDQAKVDGEFNAKAKAEKEAGTKLAEKKKQEEMAKKEEEAKALEAKKKEEQEKLQKEATEKAEKEAAEAKEKEAAEAKQKEAEAKTKEEAEAKKKEEEAEAKRKEVAEEERLKLEAEEKAKALAEQAAEAKRKEEELAEAKKKEEQEKAEKEAERLKIEAEEKAKAEQEAAAAAEQAAEAKRKEEELAEAKKKEEQEKAEKEAERLKIEAEKKAKAEQEAAAAAAAAEAEKEEELRKAEEAPAPPRSKGFRWFWQPAEPDTSEEEQITRADLTEQAKDIEQLPASSTPLSPYTRYPELKPPGPPNASTPSANVDTPKVEPVKATINKVEQITEEVKVLAEKGKEVVTEEIKEEVELLPEKGKEVVTEEVNSESQEDIEARTRQAQETAARELEAVEKATAAVSLNWLWDKTDPVKETVASTLSKTEDSVSSAKDKLGSLPAIPKSDDLPRSSRPLSPYAQFPNLKPPAPPRPSPPVSSNMGKEPKEAEPLPNPLNPLSPYPGFPDLKPPPSPTPLSNEAGNGAVPENAEETQEKEVESALSSGFKWPWQE